jgi:hypothetical protein
MRIHCFLGFALILLPSSTSGRDQGAPQLVFGTYLGRRHKDFATGVAVDGSGNAYLAGRTLSPDFPVTDGAFLVTSRVNNDDWIGFVTKINDQGKRFLYSTLLGGNYRTSANAISVDSTGRDSLQDQLVPQIFQLHRWLFSAKHLAATSRTHAMGLSRCSILQVVTWNMERIWEAVVKIPRLPLDWSQTVTSFMLGAPLRHRIFLSRSQRYNGRSKDRSMAFCLRLSGDPANCSTALI